MPAIGWSRCDVREATWHHDRMPRRYAKIITFGLEWLDAATPLATEGPMMLDIANFLTAYLPLWLPFIFAVLGIIAGAASQRIELTGSALLKVHGEMILGLFSFVTWALVTFMQNKRVDLNSEFYIDFSHVLLLLLINFALLLISIIALRHDWSKSRILAKLPKVTPHTANIVNGVVLFLAVGAAFIPLGLKQKIVDSKNHNPAFVVALPYVDNSLVEHVGALRWHDRNLCYVREIDAPNKEKAIEATIKDFSTTSLYSAIIQKKSKRGSVKGEPESPDTTTTVTILKDKAVASAK